MMDRLFVYGTLKRGFGNHGFLDGCRFLGEAHTVKRFAMYGAGVPSVVESPQLYPIQGEVYEVDPASLRHVDALEGHPHWYVRKMVDVVLESGGDPISAWIYTKDRPSLLGENSRLEFHTTGLWGGSWRKR